MWPWRHLAVGYLLYSLVYLGPRRSRGGHATVVLAFGNPFPNLVDKPIAWIYSVLPNGRSLGHSLFTAVLVVVALEIVLRHHNHGALATVFSIGYLSHLSSDALYPALMGNHYLLGSLRWPVIPTIEYQTDPSFRVHLQGLAIDPFVNSEFVFGVLVLDLWLYDGAPGVGVITAVHRLVKRKLSV